MEATVNPESWRLVFLTGNPNALVEANPIRRLRRPLQAFSQMDAYTVRAWPARLTLLSLFFKEKKNYGRAHWQLEPETSCFELGCTNHCASNLHVSTSISFLLLSSSFSFPFFFFFSLFDELFSNSWIFLQNLCIFFKFNELFFKFDELSFKFCELF